jgi:hypothetical protein
MANRMMGHLQDKKIETIRVASAQGLTWEPLMFKSVEYS